MFDNLTQSIGAGARGRWGAGALGRGGAGAHLEINSPEHFFNLHALGCSHRPVYTGLDPTFFPSTGTIGFYAIGN